MFAKVFDWFETRYSPVALAKDRQPPMGLWNFFRYFIMQFRAGFAMRMLFVAAGAVVDAMLPIFVGIIVGMLASSDPHSFFTEHGTTWKAGAS